MPRRLKKYTSNVENSLITAEFIEKKCVIIGKNIRIERAKRGFTIENLAEYLELSPPYIGLLERGQRCPSLLTLFRVCELFNVTPDDIFLEKDSVCRGSLSISEVRKSSPKSGYDAVVALLTGLNESELNYVAEMVKGYRKLTRQASENFYESDEEVSYEKKKGK